MGIDDVLGQVLYYFNQIVLQNFWNFFSKYKFVERLSQILDIIKLRKKIL
jgi:hypothetical protein